MHTLKSISPAAVPAALDKALRYRLLNEPLEAESVCQDILHIQPANQEAVVTLLLARTDLFQDEYMAAFERAKAALSALTDDYERAYYEGVIHERWAKAQTARHVPGHMVRGWYLHAMHCYERAQSLAAPDNPDAILRWNTCARVLERLGNVQEPAHGVTRDIVTEYDDETPSAIFHK
jgi:hypothetical protein